MIRNRSFLILGAFVILYSNFLTALFINFIDESGKYIPLFKDIYIILMFFILLYSSFKSKTYLNLNIFILIFFILILFSYIISNDGIFNKTYNIRRIILPFIILFIFYNLNIKDNDHKIYYKFIKINFIVFCFFGILEYSNTSFVWDYLIPINKYWAVSSVGSDGEIDFFTEGGRLFTSDTLAFLGFKIRRMISFSLEPTTFAAFMLFCFTMFFYNKRNLLASTAFLFGCLTLSKLFILGTILVVIQRVFNLYRIIYIYIGTVSLFFAAGYIYHLTFNIHGSFSHLKGFYTGFILLKDHPFGFGLGVAGNRGSQYISTMGGDFGGESGLGNILAQVGILGLFYLFIIMLIYSKIYSSKNLDNKNKNMCLSLISQYLLNFYLSASSLGILSFYFIFVHLGLAFKRK